MLKAPRALALLALPLAGCAAPWDDAASVTLTEYPEREYVYQERDPEPLAPEDVFYVAQDGSDDNPGSQSRPWRTIQHAADLLQPGQKVYVTSGVYRERVTVTRGGVPGRDVVFSAHPGQSVILDGRTIDPFAYNCMSGLIEVRDTAYVKVKGFAVRHAGSSGIVCLRSQHVVLRDNYTYDTFSSGVAAWFSSHVTIDGNEIVWACHAARPDQPTQECLSVAGCSQFEVKNNHVHHGAVGPPGNGGEGIDAKHSHTGTVHHNLVHDLPRLGVYVDAWSERSYGIQVYANVVHDCRDWGLALAAENNGTLEDVRVFNNLAYNNRAFGIGVESWGIGTHHSLKRLAIYNNTLHGNGATGHFWGGSIRVDAPEGEDIHIQNNICYWNFKDAVEVTPGRAPAGLLISHNLEGVDPLFRDLARLDFHLRDGSPAIDAADPALAPDHDFDGLPRPRRLGFDVGAFELQ